MKFKQYLDNESIDEGLFHDIKVGWTNVRQQVSLAFLQGKIEKWHEQDKIDVAGYNTITLAMNNLDALLTKKDYTDEDAETAKFLIRQINTYYFRKKRETGEAEAQGKGAEYHAAHSSGIEEM